MIETLEAIDRTIVQTVNGWNTPFLDELMWLISGKLTWIPLYILFLYLFFRQSGLKKTAVFLICAIAVVALADQISVHLFKNMFERYRPSHHALLTDHLHFYRFENGEFYKGGQFGFVSSHASNFVGVCAFALMGLRTSYRWLLPFVSVCMFIVLFSRIYLGVHYLSDVLVGGLIGFFIAFVVHRFVFMPIIGRDLRAK